VSAKVVPIMLAEIGDDRRIPVRQIVEHATTAKLDDVLIIGRTDEGDLWAESSLNAGQSLWLLEKLRERILQGSPWALV
jgi:hypothetical protein